MSSLPDVRTLGRTRLSFADEADIDEFVATLDRYERGELTPDQWRAFRLVRGTYGQRQTADAQMIRVKIPQGILDVAQLGALADVAERWSRGFGHVTTRQNVQFHFVKLHDVELAMRRLADAGLTTREACGNSVRNVTACPYAGVAEGEAFDVTPYAEALTRYLLRHPLSSSLPRKFKIAFEGCAEDHAVAAAALAGIPVTHRGLAAGFVVVSGHAETAYGPVLDSLAPHSLTVVVLMGLGSRAAVASRLLARGWSPLTPAAVVLGASTEAAHAWTGTLGSLATADVSATSQAPGTIVVGAVVSLAAVLGRAAETDDSAVAVGAAR